MRRLFGLLVVAILVGSLPTWGQSILPSSFAQWTSAATQTFAPSEPAALAAANEYGFVSGERVAYTHGTDTLTVTLYRMGDPSGAYGEYSYLRTQDMPRADLAEHSAMSAGRALVLTGNFVLDVQGKDLPKLDADLKALVANVAPRAQGGLAPTLNQHLPQAAFVDRSDRYILGPKVVDQLFPVPIGDALGFSQGAQEAEVAHYRVGGRDVTLMIVDYPTPQFASKKLVELQTEYDINNSKTNSGAAPLYAKRSLTLIAFVAGANSQAEADQLLKEVHSDAELTWDEPSFQFTQPSIGTIVVGTIIGTGIICLFALVSGLAFGGVRLVVKRALPDRVFDRSDQLQILQLGLSSKPINAEDFYGLGPGDKI
jgi:hypothetical protein